MAERPNVLFIHTDQQHFDTISALGSAGLRTPNLDRLARRGVSFTRSYSANPVCCPSRAAWFTGRPSSENGVVLNGRPCRADIPDLGQWMGSHGYAPFYTGKWHVPKRDAHDGFHVLTADPSGLGEHADAVVARSAQAFLGSYDGADPFFLSVGFVQPHDCCFWTFEWALEHGGVMDEAPHGLGDESLPPLPPNFHDECRDAPPTLRKMLDGIRGFGGSWSSQLWRYYIWSYYRMVEMVDADIGRVLDALAESAFAENTLVIFTSDHGEGLGRRRLMQKSFPYDEALRVPLIICPPGSTDGRVDAQHVTSGLDLAPTICDYARLDQMPHARGQSLRPVVEAQPVEWRDFVVSEVDVTGRVVVTPEYKLVTYEGESARLLYDCLSDPWELHNLASSTQHADTLEAMTTLLHQWESTLDIRAASH